MKIKNFLEKKFTVRYCETDWNSNIRVYCLCQWFSEIAWEHLKLLNLNFEDISDSDYFWVLLDYDIKIENLPKWQQEVNLKTYPSGINDFYFAREFVLSDKDGNFLAGASSTWLILNKQKKIIIPKGERFDNYNFITQKVVSEKIPKLKKQNDYTTERLLKVEHSDTDMHKHVNNAVYIKWIEDCIEKNKQIKELKIRYLKELYNQDMFVIKLKSEKNNFYFEGKSENNNKSFFLAEVVVE